jgi:hypothetical protein
MADTEMILSGVALFIAVSGAILGVVNHKRIRSNCCGREMSVSFDVEATTPPRIVVPNPMVTAV